MNSVLCEARTDIRVRYGSVKYVLTGGMAPGQYVLNIYQGLT